MADITAAEARQNFAELINRAAYGKERARVTRRGKGLAAVVPMEDLELLEAIEEHLDLVDFREALERWAGGGRKSLPLDKVVKKLGLR